MHEIPQRAFRWGKALALVFMLFVLCSTLCLTGCRMSDKLKEVLYDQTAETIEYDNPQKFYINDSSADEESPLVPASETSDDAPASDKKQNLVVYSSKPNSDDLVAKKSVFAKEPDFKGIEASEGVTLKYSDSEEAIDHEVPNDTEDEEEEEEDEEWEEPPVVLNAQTDEANEDAPRVAGATSSQDRNESGGETGTGGQDGSGGAADEWDSIEEPQDQQEEQEQQDPGETSADEGSPQPSETNEGGGAGGDVTVVDTTGAFTEPPKADAVAAFGEAAVIVQMVGGSGALAATDAQTLDDDFKTVFGDEGALEIAVGWSDGGTAGALDADAIIGAGAKTILVFASNYKDSVPQAELEKLNQAGVSFTVIPTLTNSTYIKQAVTTVGEILSESEEIANKGQTGAIASDYATFHDDLVNACIAANGGLLASANSRVYESKSSGAYLFNDAANYTLLLDGFDTSAHYTNAIGGWVPVCNGAAMTTLGYSASPVSFYIQAGGLVNNAAACSSSGESEKIVAWQFNTNILPAQKSNWKYADDGLMARTTSIDSSMAEGWRRTVFNTGIDPASNGAACSFGSSRFPKAIVTEARTADLMVQNSADENGLYHPYALNVAQEGGLQISAIGPIVNNSTIVYSSIGVDAEGATTEWSGGSIPREAFAVNPQGLIGSWVDGSVESVLEAPWVNDVVAGNATTVDYENYIRQFYERFYRYTLSDTELARIVEGV